MDRIQFVSLGLQNQSTKNFKITSFLQDDYMALEIVKGKILFKFDLGAGPTYITNPKPVSDNKWHEVIVERYV